MAKKALSLGEFLNSRVEDLRKLIPKALGSWDLRAVHQARVTTRRLKSALDLLETALSDQMRTSAFATALRRLRRALGPMRDVDVMLTHLQELQRQRRYAGASQWLADQLQARRKKLQRRAKEKASLSQIMKGLGGWSVLKGKIAEAEPAARSTARRAVPRQLRSFSRRAQRLSHVRLNDVRKAHEDVHLLRIDGKRLRYSLELAAPLGYDVPRGLFRSFKQLQETLGLWHDYVVLGEQALRAALDTELPLHDPQLYGKVLELSRQCWRRSEQQLDKFARLWAKDGTMIETQVRQVLQPRSRGEG